MASSGDIPFEDLKLAFAEAVESGTITRAEIAAAKMDAVQRDALRTLQAQEGKR